MDTNPTEAHESLPPVDPVENLKQFLFKIVAFLLISFPYVIAIIFGIFFIILAFFFGLFPS